MVKALAVFAAVAVVDAVSCSADDQSKIQTMDDNDFGDQSNKCGKGALGLAGINHDKFNRCLTGAIGISSECSECYAVIADYGFKNCKVACLLGWCKQSCLDCTAPGQVDLPTCTGIPAGTPSPCMEETAVQCSAADQAKIQAMDDNDFGDQSNKCGTGALSLGGISHNKFNTCLTSAIGISSTCSECYAVTADYGFKNCKVACLAGWCKQGCLDCTAPAQVDLPACTGIPAGTPTPCMEETAVRCSADEQAKIQSLDPDFLDYETNKCGTGALGLTGINHDKFNACFSADIGISVSCSDCWAFTADYGFENCKAACLLGWCKQGCLDCTAPAKDSLPACTGVPAGSSGTASPCAETLI